MPEHDPVGELYQVRGYPPMSHPSSDPALTAVAARMGGLKTPHPSAARILEIGCASGHNLIPLAMRWPEAEFTGCDISAEAVAVATRRAAEAGVGNVRFIPADLRDLDFPGGSFDYIIAHGVFSWVADDAKKALLDFCAKHLSPSGIATISFNLLAGWHERIPVIDAVRRIQREHDVSVIRGLEILREVVNDERVRWTVDDMLAKGPEILDFDDFAPVCDPWPLDHFVEACAASGLRWLGESEPAENIPSSLGDEDRASLAQLAGEPLRMQMAADEMASRAFRSGVLCRGDAPVENRLSTAMVMEMSVRLPDPPPITTDPHLSAFLEALETFAPDCVPVPVVLEKIPGFDAPAMARSIFNAIHLGQLLPRIEPLAIMTDPPVCQLDPFRLLCAKERLPLVDVWHAPCLFSERPYRLLELMDGRTVGEMAGISAELCPDLAFPVWLRHVAGRGLLGSR